MVMLCALAGAQVLGGYMHNAVGIDVKVTSICGTPRGAGPCRSRWKVPSFLLSLANSPLALQHHNLYRGLVVCLGAEDLALFWWGWWVVFLRSIILVVTPPMSQCPGDGG